jgi:signal transduction histidine kinase/CheY-like chemotaxis protein
LTSQAGLWRFDPANGTFQSYGVRDGLPSPQFSSLTVTRMPDGMVYTGTFNGIVGWNPEHMHEQPRPPRMLLTAVSVQRDGHTVRLAPDHGALHLRWNDRELHVAVQALSYLDPERNHYRFRMAGLDTGWVDTGSHGERDFTGLEHGDYRLQMEAAGPGGAWAALPPLSIRVDRPPWNTPWAWAAYVLLGGALVWLMLGRVKRRIEQRHRFQMAEQKRAMAEQASAAKSTFLATLSHEIRTPMTGVLGMAELLLRSPLQPRQREHAQTIRRSGTLLLRLVNEALDMARIEAGRLELDIARIDLRALLDDVVQLESGVARDKGLRLDVDVAADIPACVRGDELRIQQVLLNLISNALKFTEHGGIGLTLARSEDGFEFSVRDTGPGIPEASRERLFERYEQAESPQRSSGAGLGLAICKELVTLMDGRFWLKSSGPEGSTFAVWLPLPECEVPAGAADVKTPGHEPATCHVLLIEDSATVAEVIRGLLENAGHTVRHAAHGLAGLAELESDTFDVLLLDLDLPGVDGFEIARMLRQREGENAHLPIIAVTARSGGDEEQRARAAGMDDFLRKPLSGEQLEAAFGRVLGSAQTPVQNAPE